MPIDVSRNLIFIHIPKTGGTSIESWLQMFRPDQLRSARPRAALDPPNKVPQHFTLRELRRNLPPEWVDSCYKFAFVRNPWDRFLSEYVWRRKLWAQTAPRERAQRYYRAGDLESLEAFVGMLNLPEGQRVDARRGFDGHLETQLSYVVDESGSIGVDFVGRFETFESDLRRLAEHVEIELLDTPHERRGERRSDYRAYYTDYSRRAVEAFYETDAATFGYTF
jgi:sulfotransferase famil protein